MKEIRLLTANEVELRVSNTTQDKKWAQLLIYKTARTDMDLLDEVYFAENWNCAYQEIKGVMYCGIGVRASIFNKDYIPHEWIVKWNAGVESRGTGEDDSNNQKGEASDSFKRAGFLWGIGRELYKWTNIWVELKEEDFKNGKLRTRFDVKELTYDKSKEPLTLIIVDQHGNVRYTFKATKQADGKKKVETTVKDTSKQENAATSPKNAPEEIKKEELSAITPEEVEIDLESMQAEVKLANIRLWALFQKKVIDFGTNYKADAKEIKDAHAHATFDYFTQKLKFPVSDGKIQKLELSDQPRQPFVKGDTVVVFDEETIADFEKYLTDEIFLPF